MGGARVPQVPGGTAAANLPRPLKGEIGLQRDKLQMINIFLISFYSFFIAFFLYDAALYIFFILRNKIVYIYIYIH